ncbi:MAG: AMP-binding protein [Christensenellaceae bacterium]|jgi:fatty-acyl-CoA synthase|nr:AMP-binding protein [Christensenellaceae bacterium]
MKLSFETQGWKEFSWEECFALAKEQGFVGVSYEYSPRAAHRYLESARASERCRSLQRAFNEADMAIPCLAAAGCLEQAAQDEAVRDGMLAAIRLCAALAIPYVALAPGGVDLPGGEAALRAALDALLPEAQAKGVVLLVQSSGIYADTKRLRGLLDEYASDFLAALWDVHNPYRYAGEMPNSTIENLGAYVKHVYIRDSKAQDGSAPCLAGEGDVPLADVMLALRSIDYKGFLSLVWPAEAWAALGVDVALPHYANHMQRYLQGGQRRGRLYYNRSGTGKFIWKKDVLIPLTFSQMLDKVAEEFPDQYAFRYTTLDYTRTYAEFRADVDAFARALIALGVKAGDHVAVWATNVPQWYIAFWAAVKLGAVLVTVNTAYKIHEAEYLLRQSDTHTLVMIDGSRDANYVEIIQTLCPELQTADPQQPLRCKRLPFLRHVVTISSRQNGCLTWEDAMAFAERVPVEEVWRRAAKVQPDDVCNMQYTSGTTGFPKGVMLTHRNIVNNGKCIGDRMDLSTADRMMIQVPMFHCFGMVLAMTAAMTHSATLSPLPYFSPKPALTCVKQERITCFHGVPTMFIAMLEHPDFRSQDFSFMRTGIMAGSPCPEPVMRDVLEKMHMTEITIVFGQTEASPGCTMSSTSDPNEVRVATVGHALPEVECKIVDPDTNQEVPDGTNGEFVARGYNLMKGYYKMPQATAAAIDAEGWLHTGDLACRTPDGNFRITGRLKDMIIRGGENIYPKEIEEFIYTHPKVKDVQVIGVPDKNYGEEIMACVVLKAGEGMTEQEVREYVRANMARHKVPRYVDFMEGFPMNAAGKILKYKMREDAAKKYGLEG